MLKFSSLYVYDLKCKLQIPFDVWFGVTEIRVGGASLEIAGELGVEAQGTWGTRICPEILKQKYWIEIYKVEWESCNENYSA